jgi:hypothetical protein
MRRFGACSRLNVASTPLSHRLDRRSEEVERSMQMHPYFGIRERANPFKINNLKFKITPSAAAKASK